MSLRRRHIQDLSRATFDVLIIGGGINGAVSAAALTARGARVALIDARDFAGFTSQHSSNLVWGGIKYMEGYEFGLVSDLCQSRNELQRCFPSTVREIRFLTTIQRGFRFHPLVMWAGSWLYWFLGRGKTRRPRLLSPGDIARREPLVDHSDSIAGVEYSDAHLFDNDARFVFNFVRQAMDQGCIAANYVRSHGAVREADDWVCDAEDTTSGQRFPIRARALVNAAGAYADEHNALSGVASTHHHTFSKGIHLIVPRLSEAHRVLAFFASDGRLFFAIPMAHRTCIGTTDTRVEQPETSVSPEDRDFVLSNINRCLRLDPPLTNDDIIAERCGVRPLVATPGDRDDPDLLNLSRKHVIEIDPGIRQAGIFGGKLTDCLNVGDEICDAVESFGIELRPRTGRWYGEPDSARREAFFQRAASVVAKVEAADTGESLASRLWRRYGEQAFDMLDAIEADPSQAQTVVEGAGIRRCEIEHIANMEMIVKLEDFLRRRSKIALLYTRDELARSPGLREACDRLFGNEADERYREYFDG